MEISRSVITRRRVYGCGYIQYELFRIVDNQTHSMATAFNMEQVRRVAISIYVLERE